MYTHTLIIDPSTLHIPRTGNNSRLAKVNIWIQARMIITENRHGECTTLSRHKMFKREEVREEKREGGRERRKDLLPIPVAVSIFLHGHQITYPSHKDNQTFKMNLQCLFFVFFFCLLQIWT